MWLGVGLALVGLVTAPGASFADEAAAPIGTLESGQGRTLAHDAFGWVRANVERNVRLNVELESFGRMSASVAPGEWLLWLGARGAGTSPTASKRAMDALHRRLEVLGPQALHGAEASDGILIRLERALDCARACDLLRHRGHLRLALRITETNFRESLRKYPSPIVPDGASAQGWDQYMRDQVDEYRRKTSLGLPYVSPDPHRSLVRTKRLGELGAKEFIVVETAAAPGRLWSGDPEWGQAAPEEGSAVDLLPSQDVIDWMRMYEASGHDTLPAVIIDDEWVGIASRKGSRVRVIPHQESDPGLWDAPAQRVASLLRGEIPSEMICWAIVERGADHVLIVLPTLPPDHACVKLKTAEADGNARVVRRCSFDSSVAPEPSPTAGLLAAMLHGGERIDPGSQPVDLSDGGIRTSPVLELGAILLARGRRDPQALQILARAAVRGDRDPSNGRGLLAWRILNRAARADHRDLVTVLSSCDSDACRVFLDILGDLGRSAEDAQDAIRPLVDSSDFRVALWAAKAMVKVTRDAGAVAHTMVRWLGSAEPGVRRAAAFAAGDARMRDDGIVRALHACVEDTDARLQLLAAASLVRIGAADLRAQNLLRERTSERTSRDAWLARWAAESP